MMFQSSDGKYSHFKSLLRTSQQWSVHVLSICFSMLTFFGNSAHSSQVDPQFIPSQCQNLGKLYHYDYRTFRSRECRSKFESFRFQITAAYNICRKAQGLTEVQCESSESTLTRAWNDITEITNRAGVEPRVLKDRLTRFGQMVQPTWIQQCIREENGTSVNAQRFSQELEAAKSEFQAEGPRHVPPRRTRSDVPFQGISRETKQIVSAVAGAALWRFRGGWLPTGSTQTARLVTLLGFSGIGYFNGGMDGAIAGALNVAPVWINGWGNHFDIGRNGGGSTRETLMMTARGLLQTSLSGGYLLARGYDGWALGSGLGMGVCYAGGTNMSERHNITSGNSSAFLDGGTAIGEACTGGLMGLGLSTTLLNGTRNP